MNEHEIQPELLFPGCMDCTDEVADSVDIRRGGVRPTFHRVIIGISWLMCGIAALGTVSLFGMVAISRGGSGNWESVATFGFWDSTAYFLAAAMVWYFRRSFFASSVLLLTIMAISSFGLFVLYEILSPGFAPLPPEGALR